MCRSRQKLDGPKGLENSRLAFWENQSARPFVTSLFWGLFYSLFQAKEENVDFFFFLISWEHIIVIFLKIIVYSEFA